MKVKGGIVLDSNVKDVPYIVYEGAMARAERHIKRLIIVLIITTIMLAVTNIVWIWMWNQYEYIGDTTSYFQDGAGNNIIGDENAVNEPKNDEDD